MAWCSNSASFGLVVRFIVVGVFVSCVTCSLPQYIRGMDTSKLDPWFWKRVVVCEETGCWNWSGSKYRGGYARVCRRNVPFVSVHRYAYATAIAPIPAGLVLDHLCRNTGCVNPEHLEPVTDRTNILRGVGGPAVNAAKTHCKHGHEFTPENTGYHKRGWRFCRACRSEKAYPDRTRRYLRPSERAALVSDLLAGLHHKEVCVKYGISRCSIWRIRRGLAG